MDPLFLILIVGGGIILGLLVVGIVISATSERSLVEERLGKYLQDEVSAGSKKGDRSSPVGDWLEGRLEKSSWGDRTARELARADLKVKASEYISLIIIAGIGVGAVTWFFGGKNWVSALIGFVVGMMIPRMYVRRRQGQRLIRFNEQLADMLNLMVNGLRAGYSTMQAMEAVSREMPPPISDEFRRVVQEMQIGLPMEKALENLLRRIPSDDLDLVITAINVQREVGGNLAEILDTISYTIRERVRIKGEIRVLTAQVVYSGRFLALMPLIIIALLWMMNKPYMMQFFNPETRVIGIIMLSIGGLMIAAGFFVMNKIASIDI
jgi:tight adherence protein B